MELDKKIIIDCLFYEAKESNIELYQGKLEMYVYPANNFACPMTWLLKNKNNEYSDIVLFIEIQEYLKEYFKYNASRRIANKLTLEMKDGKVIDIVPSWDQSIVDEFYNNLPAKMRNTHIGWYDKP
jgi:hypothetical protein